MRGSKYPNGVRVNQSSLRFTETSKSNEILRDRVDWTSRGVYTGFEVTVNATDSTLIDVAQGSGFAPNGEYVETTSDYFSIALDDYTIDVVNYVCAVYTESSTHNQPHESDGFTYGTRAEMAWRIRVYSATNYAALSLTDDNLANDARDRMIVLAKVTGNGTGVSLTSGDITSPTTFSNILYPNPSELLNIVGVTVMDVSSGTTTGLGTLSYTYAVGPTYTFTWTSFGGGAGTPVNVTSDGYWNFQDGLGEYIRCYIVLTQLPVTGSFPLTEGITIINLYEQDIPRLTAQDTYHRNLTGTGVVSPTNPHGTSVEDIAGDDLPQLEEHQDVMHCNGIWRGSSATILSTSVLTSPPIADTLVIQVPLTSDLFYINGNKLNSVNNSTIPFTPWQTDWGTGYDVVTNFFEVYVNDTGDVKANRKASYPSSRDLSGTWIVDMSDNYPAGNYQLDYQDTGSSTTISWDSGIGVTLSNADWGVAGNSRVIRLYDRDGIRWVDLWVNMDDAKAAGDDSKFNSALGPLIDPIEVTASTDQDATMQIASLVYWYDSTGPKGKLGFAPNTGTRRVLDKRPFGTLCVENMADKGLQDMVYNQQDEMHYSGVLLDRNNPGVDFDVIASSGLNLVLRGGNYYCRGQRLQGSQDTAVVNDNAVNLVYIDMDGAYQVIDVTTDYSGDIQAAMKFVLGGASFIPAEYSDVHNTDSLDPPERGVLLYLANASGGVITYYEDFMRNVNGPVENWTVAKRVTDSDTGRLAQFDSLNAAFEYAAMDDKLSEVTIRLIGDSELNNRRILQPPGTTVIGQRRVSSTVLLQHADLNGVWCLSYGCTVSNVNIQGGTNTTAVFGIASQFVTGSTASTVTVEGCYYDSTLSFAVDSSFIVINETGFTGPSLSDIYIKDNIIKCGAYAVWDLNPGTINFYNFHIKGNVINMYDPTTTSAIALTGNAICSGVHIIENKIESTGGVFLGTSENCDISHNFFELRDNTAQDIRGIRLSTCSKITIDSNTFAEGSGNTSTQMDAIFLSNVSECTISSNVITDYHNGIRAVSDNYDHITVTGNVIDVKNNGSGSYGTGIILTGDDLVITGNDIRAEANGIAVGKSTGGNRILVEGNNVYVLTNNPGQVTSYNMGAGGCYGIVTSELSYEVQVLNNKVTIAGVGGSLADKSAPIHLKDVISFTISGNNVSVTANTILGTSLAWQIYAGAGSNGSFVVADNKIDNRSGVANPSPVEGLSVTDIGASNSIGKVSGNLVDGTNITTDSIYELNVSTVLASSHIVLTDNVISTILATGTPKTTLSGGIITQNNSTLVDSTGSVGNI